MTAKEFLEIGVVGVRMAQEKANQPESETGTIDPLRNIMTSLINVLSSSK